MASHGIDHAVVGQRKEVSPNEKYLPNHHYPGITRVPVKLSSTTALIDQILGIPVSKEHCPRHPSLPEDLWCI